MIIVNQTRSGSPTSPSNYGLAGDGITDDTAKLQSALDAASASGGGTVWLLPGTYSISGVTIGSKVWLRGSGMKATTLNLRAGSNRPVVTLFRSPDQVIGNAEYAGVLDIGIDGNRSNQSGGLSHGIYQVTNPLYTAATGDLDWDIHHVLERVWVQDIDGDGVHLEGRGETRISNVQVYRANSHGFWLGADAFLALCTSGHTGLSGFYGASISSGRLTGCKAFFAGRIDGAITAAPGFQMVGCLGLALSGCEAQDNAGQGFLLDNCGSTTLAGCVADSNSAGSPGAYAGFDLFDSSRCVISGSAWERRADGINSNQINAIKTGGASQSNTITLSHEGRNGGVVGFPTHPNSTAPQGTVTINGRAYGSTPSSGEVPITARAQWNTYGPANTGTTGRTTRTLYRAVADCADLRLTWVGRYGTESALPANSYFIKATLELVPAPQPESGTLTQITFSGDRTVVVAPGKSVRSDSIPVNLRAGDYFYVRVYASVTTPASEYVLLGRQHNDLLYESTISGSDAADSTGAWTGSTGFSCGPVQITGRVAGRAPTLAIVGSSTFEGTGDLSAGNPGGNVFGWGWVRDLVGDGVGLAQIAKAGAQAQNFVVAQYLGRMPLTDGCIYAAEGLGANDINNGRTYTQVVANKLQIWTALAARGMQVWTPTIHPTLTTSTDSFATTTNQTPAATNSIRVALNSWIRAGAPIDPTTKAAVAVGTPGALLAGSGGHPLVGYLEVADVVETARGSGIYKVGYTTDGQHLTSAACQAVVAAVQSPWR